MDENKKFGLVMIGIVILLLLSNSFLLYTLNHQIEKSNDKIQFFSYWYCMEGTYNTQQLYEHKYNISQVNDDYLFLTSGICWEFIYGNDTWDISYQKILNYSQ